MKLENPHLIAGGDQKALAAIMPTLVRCARAGAVKVGAEFLADDVTQELAILLVQKLAAKYDPTYNIEPLLIGCARHISLAMLHSNREFNRDDIEDTIVCHNNGGCPPDAWSDDASAVDSTDIEKAEQKIRGLLENTMDLMPGVTIGDTTAAQLRAKKQPRKPKAPALGIVRHSSPEHIHMRKMRDELQYSQATWAKHLEVSTATVAAIEYGRVQKVNKDIYAKALSVFQRGGRVIKSRSKFDGREMSTILNGWAKRLHVDPDDSRALATLLKKELSTIHRWRHNEQRPNIHALEEYDDRVTRLATALKEERGILNEVVAAPQKSPK
ncbi:MAG: hypothetical protein D4S02_06765 [Rhodocyclaceae bacterium]|nr:MAG: hypothetical protein D4S02_06765 [Rhodocyclaceae bacterium]